MSEAGLDLRRAAAGGVIWTASSHLLRQAIQVGVTAVLARHLAPADFGLVGMAAATLALVTPLNEMGLGAALVQRKDLTAAHASSVFWCQVGAATLIGILLAIAAPVIGAFFNREDLVPLLRLMCLNLPVGAAASAPQALLIREMRFGRVAGVETAALAGSGALAVAMALAGMGVWSLAAQALAGAALTAALMSMACRFNPVSRSARPDPRHVRELASFSGPLTGYQVLNFISRNADDVLIGRFLGAEALGYYTMAYRVMMYPLQKVSGIVGRVSFPAFSLMQDDRARIRRSYLKAVQYIALVTFPMMAAAMVAAPELVGVLFGRGWAPVAPLIVVLSLAGISGSIGTTVGSLFLATGRSDLMLRWEIVASSCYITAIASGLPWGLMGVAIAYTAMALILWPISHAVANRLIDLRTIDLFGALVAPAVLAAGLAASLAALKLIWGPVEPVAQVMFLAACGAAGLTALAAAALSGRPAAAAEAMALALEAISRMRPTRQTRIGG